ncbi:MAG: hypothetical protein H7138_12455 [Myxococcales bacterium]|nr:hypothetical protein [Myxococcales bacterium]
MDVPQRQSALLLALTTEHFVLQGAASATTAEAASRTSIYLLSLSSSLVAIGFASQSPSALRPLIFTVLPVVTVLGLLTLIRLVDITSEYRQCLLGIAQIRGYYRTLGPEAAVYFATARGRWPEPGAPNPSVQLGSKVAFLTTASTMIATINSVVFGAVVTWLARAPLGGDGLALALAIGSTAAGLLMLGFLRYQTWRFQLFDEVLPAEDVAL